LLDALKGLQENECLSDTNICKAGLVKEKRLFDSHVSSWFTSQKMAVTGLGDNDSCSQFSFGARSNLSHSSTANEKRRSQVKLKVASAELSQETVKVYETRLRAKQRAEKIRLEAQEDSERIMKETKAMVEARER